MNSAAHDSSLKAIRAMMNDTESAHDEVIPISKPLESKPQPLATKPAETSTAAPRIPTPPVAAVRDLELSVVNWLLEGGEQPAEPRTLYRGVVAGKDDVHPDTVPLQHATPWQHIASRAGKVCGNAKISTLPAQKGQKYYRGGSLAGDPLESTRVNSIRGFTWDQALARTKEIYDEGLRIKLRDEKNQIEHLKTTDPAKAEMHIKSLGKESALDALCDLVNGTFETDVLNRPGYWSGGLPIPKELNLNRPRLRTKDEVKAWREKHKLQHTSQP